MGNASDLRTQQGFARIAKIKVPYMQSLCAILLHRSHLPEGGGKMWRSLSRAGSLPRTSHQGPCTEDGAKRYFHFLFGTSGHPP